MYLLADVRASSALTFADNTHFFYIGSLSGTGNLVNGFIMDWSTLTLSTCNPSLAALANHGESGQLQAADALSFDANTNRIYYKTTNGSLAYFQANASLSDFYYYDGSDANSLLDGAQLKIQGNLAINYDPATDTTRIYFVGHQFVAHWYFIYCLEETPAGWSLHSPSMSSGISPFSTVQSDPSGIIAISPDGTMIAYFGTFPAPFVYYFLTLDGVHYSFNSTVIAGYAAGDNSLQFTSNADIFYINFAHANVHHLKIQEAYCENPWIAAYED